MLLSRDGTKAFVAVPKTGSNSVRDILIRFCGAREVVEVTSPNDWSMVVQRFHSTVANNLDLIQLRFPHADVSNITAYGFLRDPVARWCSAVDFYYKRDMFFLLDLQSVKNNPKKVALLADTAFTERFHSDQFHLPFQPENAGTRMVREFFSPDVVAEMASVPWENFPVKPDDHPFFYPQAYWLKQPNTVILDYSKMNEELAWLVNVEWRGNLYYQKSNSSYRNKSEIPKLPVSKEMRQKIMDAYKMDYDLTPHTLL